MRELNQEGKQSAIFLYSSSLSDESEDEGGDDDDDDDEWDDWCWDFF